MIVLPPIQFRLSFREVPVDSCRFIGPPARLCRTQFILGAEEPRFCCGEL